MRLALTRTPLVFAILIGFCEAAMYSVLAPVLPALTREVSASTLGAGVLTAAYPAGLAVAMLPSALAVRRFGERRVTIAGLWCLAVSSIAFAFADTEVGLDAARFVQGAGSCAAWTGVLAWLAVTYPPDLRASAMGFTFSAAYTGVLIGPLLGILVADVGRDAVFVVWAVALGALACWGGPRLVSRATDSGNAAARGFRNHPTLSAALIGIVFFGIIAGGVNTLGPLLLAERGLSSGAIAACFLAATAPQVVVTPLLGRHLTQRRALRAIVVGLLANAVALLLLDVAVSPWITAVLFSIAVALGLVVFNPMMYRVTTLTERAQVAQGHSMALANGGWGVGAAVGGVALAQFAAGSSIASACAVTGGICVVMAGFLLAVER